MADRLQLRVITPSSMVLDTEVDEVVVPGQVGEFGVLPGHIPFVTTTVPGLLSYKDGSGTGNLIIYRGIADVNEGSVMILTDDAEDPEKADKEAVKREVRMLEDELSRPDKTEEEAEELVTRLKILKIKLGIEYYESPV